jgi:hypothetical protein
MMIRLWKLKVTNPYVSSEIVEFRRAIEAEWCRRSDSIHIGYVAFGTTYRTKDGRWSVVRGITLGLRKVWEFGQGHLYYDGPHCSYMFGPFVLNVDRDHCDKCYEEGFGSGEHFVAEA